MLHIWKSEETEFKLPHSVLGSNFLESHTATFRADVFRRSGVAGGGVCLSLETRLRDKSPFPVFHNRSYCSTCRYEKRPLVCWNLLPLKKMKNILKISDWRILGGDGSHVRSR